MRPPNPNGYSMIQRCEHKNSKVAENYTNINVQFCPDCGTVIATEWDGNTQEIGEVYYLSPFEMWEGVKLLKEALEAEIHVDGEWVDESGLESLKDKIREWMIT